MNEKGLLLKYVPENSVDMVMALIVENNVHLKITRQRKTKLGDYRPPSQDNANHRISINYNLNKYSFLLTLIHELAHLQVWCTYKNSVLPHGPEWKQSYRQLIKPFLKNSIFPNELLEILLVSMNNFKASSGSDLKLMRALKIYDHGINNDLLLENLNEGDKFFIAENRVFEKGKKRRTKYLCIEQKSKRPYLFHPLTPIKKLPEN